MSKVTITADPSGNVVGVSTNNPEFGFIRVEQVATQINEEGWLKHVRRSALIKGKVEDLVECGYQANQEIPGKIVVRESLEPFNPNNPDKDLKLAGSTGIICRIDDQPIYRNTFFTTNLNSQDEFIMHDNGDEIRDVQGAQKAMKSISGLKIKTTEPATLDL
jgi:hypothetical protein